MSAHGRQHLITLVILLVMAVGVYLAGFVRFIRYHGAIQSMRTGELVFTVPDTTEYRLMTSIYAPVLYLSHSRINPDPRATK